MLKMINCQQHPNFVNNLEYFLILKYPNLFLVLNFSKSVKIQTFSTIFARMLFQTFRYTSAVWLMNAYTVPIYDLFQRLPLIPTNKIYQPSVLFVYNSSIVGGLSSGRHIGPLKYLIPYFG